MSRARIQQVDPAQYYTRSQVAGLFGRHRRSAVRWVANGLVASEERDGQTVIPGTEIWRLIGGLADRMLVDPGHALVMIRDRVIRPRVVATSGGGAELEVPPTVAAYLEIGILQSPAGTHCDDPTWVPPCAA